MKSGDSMSAAPSSVTASFPIGALFAGVGGVLAGIGSFMEWETGVFPSAVYGFPVTGLYMNGWDGYSGKIEAILGVIALTLAIVWALTIEHPMPPFRAYGVALSSNETLIVMVGVCVLIVAGITYGDVSASVDRANAFGQSIPAANLTPGTTKDFVYAHVGTGLWLDLLAGVLVTLGGFLGLLARRGRA
jgi:hypothetical protein